VDREHDAARASQQLKSLGVSMTECKRRVVGELLRRAGRAAAAAPRLAAAVRSRAGAPRLIREFEREAKAEGQEWGLVQRKKSVRLPLRTPGRRRAAPAPRPPRRRSRALPLQDMVTQLNKFVSQKKKREEELQPKLELALVASKGKAAKIPATLGDEEAVQMLGEGFTMTAPDGSAAGGVDPESHLSSEQLVADGRREMKGSEAAVLRSARVVDDMLALSRGTAVMLEEQTGQMRGVEEELTVMRFNLGKARVLMRDIARRIATDKFIILLVGLLVAGIIAVIVLKTSGVDFSASPAPAASPALAAASPPPPPPGSAGRRLLLRAPHR